MDIYHIWFDLKETSKDLEFTRNLANYMGYLKERDLIHGYRLTRRMLGLSSAEIGEFHVAIEVRDLVQLDAAFLRAASRDEEVEPSHAAVYRMITGAKFALYRDFPDMVRAG